MDHFVISNLVLVVTVLSVSLPTEVQGQKSLELTTRDFYNYLNPRKRVQTRDEVALDGQILAGNKEIIPSKHIYYKNKAHYEDKEPANNNGSKKSSAGDQGALWSLSLANNKRFKEKMQIWLRNRSFIWSCAWYYHVQAIDDKKTYVGNNWKPCLLAF